MTALNLTDLVFSQSAPLSFDILT